MATIKPNEHFAPAEAAVFLERAMKGAGTNESDIIKVLSSNTANQRAEIAAAFKAQFDKELAHEFKRELKGSFRDACIAMLDRIPMMLAKDLQNAMKGLGTKERVLTDILCTSTDAEMEAIKLCYNEAFQRDLAKEVARETRADFQKLLETLIAAHRAPGNEVHEVQAKADAEALYKAGEKRMGTNEKVFTEILCSRSFPQLRQTFVEYDKLTGHGFDVAVKKETRGDLEMGYLTIVHFAKDGPAYFASRLHESMKGKNDDNTIIRIIVSRSENDLEHIAKQFEVLYGKRLSEFVEEDCKGDFGKLMKAIVD